MVSAADHAKRCKAVNFKKVANFKRSKPGEVLGIKVEIVALHLGIASPGTALPVSKQLLSDLFVHT
jgi:hypothetical protein